MNFTLKCINFTFISIWSPKLKLSPRLQGSTNINLSLYNCRKDVQAFTILTVYMCTHLYMYVYTLLVQHKCQDEERQSPHHARPSRIRLTTPRRIISHRCPVFGFREMVDNLNHCVDGGGSVADSDGRRIGVPALGNGLVSNTKSLYIVIIRVRACVCLLVSVYIPNRAVRARHEKIMSSLKFFDRRPKKKL